jgi:inhibitor of KinA
MTENVKIFPLGDNALTVEFGREISVELNRRAIKLGEFFEHNRFPGYVEIVPAYASLSIFYDARLVRQNYPQFATAFEAVRDLAANALPEQPEETVENAPRLIEIPVSFDSKYAPDLEFVANSNHLTARQVIEIFTATTYRVYMLGFLPGFAYMGEVDRRIAAARKTAPRLEIAAGSVGIAGRQTGIYPSISPGGWQIIGKTEIHLFTPEAKNPSLLQAGDAVRFYEI